METRQDSNALQLLESEDLELRDLFSELRHSRGSSVDDRAEYGDIAKEIVRHVAVREAALVDVATVAADDPQLRGLADRIEHGRSTSRPHIDRVEKMSRGIQGINLRTGQDFDSEMEELIQLIGTEIEWDLSEAIPELSATLKRTEREGELQTARHLRKHAPTKLHPEGPRWWERAPIISRFLTIYDHLRDFPKGRNRRA